MKVTQVLYSGLGGHGSVAFSIFDGDSAKKTTQSFVFYGIEPIKDEYIQKCKEKNIAFAGINTTNQSILKNWWLAFKYIIRQKPDVVLLHSTTLFVIVPFLRLVGIKIIAIDHTPNATKPKQEWLAVRLLKYLSNKMVFLTQIHFGEIQQVLGENYFSKQTTAIINNGIDTHFFVPEVKTTTPPFQLMMQARFSETKDFQTLIKTAALLKKRGWEKHFVVSLAGDGTTFKACQLLAKELNTGDNVVFKGMLNEAELKSLLGQTHIYVHSSLSEAMSTSIMQALSSGLMVVASDISGNKSLIHPNENGLLFPTGNAEALADILEAIFKGEVDFQEYTKKAREYAVKHLSMEKMFQSYYALMQ